MISYERNRAAWSKICEVIISSSAPVCATKAFNGAATVSGAPIAEHDSTESSIARSCGAERLEVAAHRRLQARRAAAAQVHESLLHRGRQELRFLVGVGGKHVKAEHDVRLVQLRRRLEIGAVEFDRLHHHLRREVRGERIRQAEGGGELGAEQARAEDPERHVQAGARECARTWRRGESAK